MSEGGEPNLDRGERLQKVLARAGIGSRRTIEAMIEAGRVVVDGVPARLGQRVDPSKHRVEVDGSLVPLQADLAHYLLNKPVGVVTTASDPEGRETVIDLVEASVRIWPVGRLDVDTEGALLLTNDGELTHRLTHPSFGVPKTYLAEVKGVPAARVLRALARGVELDDGLTAPARVELVERYAGSALVEIEVAEGRHRQVRRMFDAVEHPVRRLVRTAVGPLKLGRLKPGTYRKLSSEEVRALYRACGM
jgi:23S rRNA pseudouridine2605 synthase